MAKSEKRIIKLSNVRLSFPVFDKPRAFGKNKDGTPKDGKFQATGLLDPTNREHEKTIAELQAEAVRVAKEKWGDNVEMKKLTRTFGKGDKKALDEEGQVNDTYAAYAGKYYVAAGSSNKPLIANRNGELIEAGSPQYPYAGCFVNIKVTLYPWEFTGDGVTRKGISVELRSVQYVRDGEAFGGRTPIKAEDEFEGLGDDPAADGAPKKDEFDE